ASRGELFLRKENSARLTALIATLLLGLFLSGGVALTLHTRRTSREAERKIAFATQVSHELRTPLTSIRMFADMLAVPGLPEEKPSGWRGTRGAEGGRLGTLTERLLALNAREHGPATIAVGRVAVAAIVRGPAEELRPPRRAAGLMVERDAPAGPVPA